MNGTLLKALLATWPVLTLFSGALILFLRQQSISAFFQLLGSFSLVVVVLSHVCEALHLLPWMGWGMEHSPGHYIDLFSALISVSLFPVGYLLHAITEARVRHGIAANHRN